MVSEWLSFPQNLHISRREPAGFTFCPSQHPECGCQSGELWLSLRLPGQILLGRPSSIVFSNCFRSILARHPPGRTISSRMRNGSEWDSSSSLQLPEDLRHDEDSLVSLLVPCRFDFVQR